MHHFGAKSGSERVTPLAFWSVSDNAVAVLASNRRAPRHPDWYYNLVAHPTTTVKLGQTWSVRARVAAPEERRKMTDRLVAELGAARREPAEQLRAERQAQLRRIRDLAGVTTSKTTTGSSPLSPCFVCGVGAAAASCHGCRTWTSSTNVGVRWC